MELDGITLLRSCYVVLNTRLVNLNTHSTIAAYCYDITRKIARTEHRQALGSAIHALGLGLMNT
jgi:hypothetical protein